MNQKQNSKTGNSKRVFCKVCFCDYPEFVLNEQQKCPTCQKEEYSGWTNWETWNLKLWMDNEESLYRHTMELVADNPEDHDAEEALKDWAQELLHGSEDGIPAVIQDDISLHRVNYREIIQAYRQTIKENEQYNKKEDE